MKKSLILLALAAILVALPAAAQFGGVNGARSGVASFTAPAPDPAPGVGVALMEGFDDITTLVGNGWFLQNNPDAPGALDQWFQGNPAVFPSQAGADDAYAAANFNTTGGSLISNWMVTPELDFEGFDTFSFWTRTAAASTFPDRMEVRAASPASTDVGMGPMDIGDFTTLLVEINPNLDTGGYPEDWTQFTITRDDLIMALGGAPTGTGRVAFRYFVDNAGPLGANSNFIGVDTVEFVEGDFDDGGLPIPAASTYGLMALALLLAIAAAVVLRRS